MKDWKKVKFTDAFDDITGGNQKFKTNEYLTEGQIPVIDQGKELIAGYIDDESISFTNVPVIIFGDHTRILKYIDFPFVLGADGVKVLKPKPSIFTKFSYYALQKVNIPNTGYNRHFKWLKESEILLPDLATQQHIAKVLDQADALRQQNRQLLAQYDELLQATFIELFGDPVKNEKGWEVKKLGEVSQKIQIGPFGSLLHEEDYITGGIPLINPTHINQMKIYPNINLTISKDKFQTLKNYHLLKNDIIMGRRGAMARCALITEKENGWLCGTGSLFVRPSKFFNPYFLVHILSSEQIKTVLESEAQGITMANLNTKIIKNLPIPIPPLPLQQHFAKIVETIEEQKEQAKASLAASEVLFEGLLAEYFG